MMKMPDVPRDVALIDWQQWQPRERAVLSLVMDEEDQLLLIHKKTGLGAGKINAPGGRIEAGEASVDAAVRETVEETGVTPLEPVQSAELSFMFTDGYSIHGTIFVSNHFQGSHYETREATPFWCPLQEIPYEKMWEDDRLWLPKVLSGIYVCGYFIFEGDTMLSHRIEERC
jgi:8-oxo-dGTP diphosphatase